MRIRGHLPALIALGFCVTALLMPLGRFGMWDPWEIAIAEEARNLMSGGATGPSPQTSARLTQLGFNLFGLRDWAGRLPGALAGMWTLFITYQFTARYLGRWSGLLALVVTAGTPLFILNTLMMGGHAHGMALQASIIYAGLRAQQASKRPAALLWTLSMMLAAALAVLALGGLVGALPPLLALATAYLLARDGRPGMAGTTTSDAVVNGAAGRDGGEVPAPLARPAGNTVLFLSAALVTLTIVTLYRDRAGYSPWTGGIPRDLQPPGFDIPLEQIFHGLAPASALLPLAWAFPFARALGKPDTRTDQALAPALICTLWCVAAYGAQTLFLARYGASTTFLPTMAVGYLTAYLLRHVQLHRRALTSTALATVLLSGLLLRDFALYPEAPLAAFPADPAASLSSLDLSLSWTVVLAAFALCTALPLAVSRPTGLDFRGPLRLIQTQWQRGWAFRAWLFILAASVFGVCLLSGLSWTRAEALQLSQYGRMILRPLGLLCLLSPVVLWASQAVLAAASRLGRLRFAPTGAAAMGTALFLTHGFLPLAGNRLSPHGPYIAFNRLAPAGAKLATFNLNPTVAGYYTNSPIEDTTDLHRFTQFLAAEDNHWGVLRLKDFPSVNSRYRGLTGRHLFVPDSGGGTTLLATGSPVPATSNHNPLSEVVRDTLPKRIQHPVHAVFDGKLELLGYDLAAKDGVVARGDTIELTWYFKVLKRVYTDYSVFVHIDWERDLEKNGRGRGEVSRIHGDHAPVSDQLPVYLWGTSDIVVDRHQVQVASNVKPGQYRIWMGFFQRKKRLPVTAGPKDDADRVQAGVLRIR